MRDIAVTKQIQPSELIKATPTQIAEQTVKDLARQEAIAENLFTITDHVFNDANNAFAGYTDLTGRAASAPGRFKTSINTRIKLKYGKAREEMPMSMRIHCTAAYSLMTDAIYNGIKQKLTREQIKHQVSTIIELMASQWKAITEEVSK